MSEAPKEAPAAKKYTYNPEFKTDEEKKEEVRLLLLKSGGEFGRCMVGGTLGVTGM